MSPTLPVLRDLLVCSWGLTLLAACAAVVDPSKPGDAAMSCDQVTAEIAQQDAAAQLAERRASELRPGYYRYQAAEMIPIVGTVFGLADQMGDASHSRELDHLNEDARDAQHRRDYLKGIQSVHCGRDPQTASSPPQSVSAEGLR
jgi:hypothetical protein